MKKDLTNPLVIISFFLILATIILFIYYYFIKPIKVKDVKTEVDLAEKEELTYLTKAYLNQNKDLNINKLFFDVNLNEYKVAAEYYYLKNGKDYLDKYEDILDTSKKIFDNQKILFDNFIVNLDECGKEKYSTLEGFTYKDVCDLESTIYQIDDIYKEEELYVVEFFASVAKQGKEENQNECDTGFPFSYHLKLTNLENFIYQDNSYMKCSEKELEYGVIYLKNEILDEMKESNYKYKLLFKKNADNFTFYTLKK